MQLNGLSLNRGVPVLLERKDHRAKNMVFSISEAYFDRAAEFQMMQI